MSSDPEFRYTRSESNEVSPWTIIRNDPFSVSNTARVLWRYYVVPHLSGLPMSVQISIVGIVLFTCIGVVVIPPLLSNDQEHTNNDNNMLSKCELILDGFNSHNSLASALNRLKIGDLIEDINRRSEANCKLKKRHVYWATLLSQPQTSGHDRVLDVEISSSNSSISIDPLVLVHPVPSTATQPTTPVTFEPLNAITGTIKTGIAIEEIELQEDHIGAILLICAGETSQDERVARPTLRLDVTSC